jgi:dethiobiotin synthetase
MARFFISATGTDAGKTFLTCMLIRQLRAAGISVLARKPVASGVQPDDATSDAALLADALGLNLTPAQAAQQLSAYSFALPEAPNRAAKAEDVVMDWGRIVDFCAADARAEVELIEGAGGLFSPITDTKNNADLACALGLPVVLVGGTYLGSVSHITATLLAAEHYGLHVQALVLNQSAGEGALPPAELAQMLYQQPIALPPMVLLEHASCWEEVPLMLEMLEISS